MNRAEILEAARQAVMVDRAATHGDAEDTFGHIAAVWSARLGITVTPAQVCILMADLKSARAWGNPGHDDNWTDGAGYFACGGEIATNAPRTAPRNALDDFSGVDGRQGTQARCTGEKTGGL